MSRKLNALQKKFLREVVRDIPDKLELYNYMYSDSNIFNYMEDIHDYETLHHDIDRYVNDEFIKQHGAKI